MEIPIGNTREEITQREVLIRNFYRQWKEKNPTQRKYNLSLKDYINIRYVSIDETSRHGQRHIYLHWQLCSWSYIDECKKNVLFQDKTQ